MVGGAGGGRGASQVSLLHTPRLRPAGRALPPSHQRTWAVLGAPPPEPLGAHMQHRVALRRCEAPVPAPEQPPRARLQHHVAAGVAQAQPLPEPAPVALDPARRGACKDVRPSSGSMQRCEAVAAAGGGWRRRAGCALPALQGSPADCKSTVPEYKAWIAGQKLGEPPAQLQASNCASWLLGALSPAVSTPN